MEQFVFRNFMKNGVVQKTIIFADAFHLNINRWRPSNTKDHPYRINFYCDNLLVGYIDAEIYEIGSSKYVETNMPIVLFTPFGKIIGYFSTHSSFFNFSIENRKDSFEKIDGLFKVEKFGELHNGKYSISSSIVLNGLGNNNIQVAFNRLESNYIVDITNFDETVRLYFTSEYIGLDHINFSKCNRQLELAKIKIELDNGTNSLFANFEFINGCSYQKDIEIKDEFLQFMSRWTWLSMLDFNIIGEEIAKNDPAMYSLIDEIKNALTLLANGITPVSIYDKIVQLCFFDEGVKFLHDFTRAQSTKTALTDNMILKKMNNHQQ